MTVVELLEDRGEQDDGGGGSGDNPDLGRGSPAQRAREALDVAQGALGGAPPEERKVGGAAAQ